MSVNRVLLTGRLTADPDLKVAGESKTVICSMRLAIQRRRMNGTDRGAIYVDVTAFERQAQNCAKYLRKGSRVAIDGRLEHSEWTTEDGHKRAKHEIVAQEVEFLDTAPSATPTPENQPADSPDAATPDEQPETAPADLAAVAS